MTSYQKGSALIFSLIILLVMTIIGISALGTTTLEERMAANDRNQRVAFQAAEAALTEGERDLAGINNNNNNYFGVGGMKEKFSGATVGYYESGAMSSDWDTSSDCIATTVQGYNSNTTPCYKVEEIGIILPIEAQEYPYQLRPQISRITARGADSNDQTGVTVESYYRLMVTNPQ